MTLKNTPQKFGSLTKLLHWTIFILFMVQYFLVYRREYFPKGSPEKLQYILLHKSFGVCLFVLAFVMLLWRHAGTRPALSSQSKAELLLAKTTHFLLYVCMLAFPLTGIAMSMFGGKGVAVFGFALPNPVQKNEALGGIFYNSHVWISYLVMGLVGLHVLGALYHHFYRKDNVLRRMAF
jgi:cytochrome b561